MIVGSVHAGGEAIVPVRVRGPRAATTGFQVVDGGRVEIRPLAG